MKMRRRSGTLEVLGFAIVWLLALSGGALSQGAAPVRRAEPVHSPHPGAEIPVNAAPAQSRDADFKRIDDELERLQQSIDTLSKSPEQFRDASTGAAPPNASAQTAPRLPAPAASSTAPAVVRAGPSLPAEDQYFAFKGDKSPSETLILLLVSGIMGMVGQGARTIVGLKKLSDNSQTASGQSAAFSASRLAVGLMIGFVAGVAGGMTPKVFNAPTITSDVLFYLASIGYMGVDVIEGFTNTISSRGQLMRPPAPPVQMAVAAPPPPETSPPTSHDIAPTRPPPPPPAHSSNEEINEALQYSQDIEEASQKQGIPAEYICGVGSRESLWGLALRPKGPAGTGDWAPRNGRMPPDGLGWGRGLMQIDYASHPFAQTGDWRDPAANIAYGGDILGQNYDYFRRARYPGVDPLRAAIAAYNCGVGNVEHAIQAGEDVDARTTGRNYSQDVLRRAAAFKPYFGTSTLTS